MVHCRGGRELGVSRIQQTIGLDTTVVVELEDGGILMGKAFDNRIIFSIDVHNDKIAALRKYVGDIDPEVFLNDYPPRHTDERRQHAPGAQCTQMIARQRSLCGRVRPELMAMYKTGSMATAMRIRHWS